MIRTSSLRAALAVAALLVCACATGPGVDYPATARVDQVDDYFGTRVADPYRWLEDDNAPATRAWVEAQNRVTFAYLDAIPFRAALRARIRAIVDYPRYSNAFRKNDDIYFFRNNGLQNQAVLYVQKGLEGTPEVVLDPNTFSADGTVRLASFKLNRDGRLAAYETTPIAGSDWRELHVLDLATRRPLPDLLRWVRFSEVAWRGDGFYYSRYPEPAKGSELTATTANQSVWYHRIGTAQAEDTLVFADPAHPRRFNGIETTEDERFAVRTSREPGRRGNDLWVRDESRREQAFRPVVAEIGDDRYALVDNVGAELLLQTTRGAPNGRVVRVDPARPAEAAWTTVIAEQRAPLEQISAAGGRLFASYLQDVTSRVEVHAVDGALENVVALPGPGSAAGFHGEHGDREVFFTYNAMNRPPTIFRYRIDERDTPVFRADPVPGFDPARYESRQVFATSRDGTRVPMFLVHRKGLVLDGRNPTILYGYGGFNISLHPTFSAARIAWLEQGGVFALANLRGGGEYGEAWHEAGMRLRKQNVFDDCVAAARWLIDQHYTSPARLALQGGSNGGLLVGAVVNQHPELFKVALPAFGVMDMLRFQKFSVGAAWTADYGSSDDEAQFRALLAYSPLHNIRAGVAYPATLVSTADHDDRVVPAHSFKYIATLQEKAGAGTPKLIRIETSSGHGASNLSKQLDEVADVYAFTWANMGFVPTFPPTPP